MTTPLAVITGAAGGLGQATARQLLAAGFDVVAVTRDARSAQAARQALGRTVQALSADLTDRAAVRTLASGCGTPSNGWTCSSTTRGRRSRATRRPPTGWSVRTP